MSMLEAIFGKAPPRPSVEPQTPTDVHGRDVAITPDLFDKLFEPPPKGP